MKLTSLHSQKGMTLIEFLVVTIIGVIALMALAVPFVGERRFWGQGQSQVEAQRDAQLVTQAIARDARESSAFAITGAVGSNRVTFTTPCGALFFEGGTAFTGQLNRSGKLFRSDACSADQTTALIDGIRSRVTNFTATSVVADKIVDLQINVQHENQRTEILRTRLYLRNG